VKTIARSAIKNADYNPRQISAQAKKKLRTGLEKLGLIQPLVWNQRTGNLVGGHQRLDILDKLAGGKTDYTLQCAVVDLTTAAEHEANILLNNPEAMGEWDLAKLDTALRVPGLRLEATGFDMADVFQVLGDSPFTQANADAVAALADAQRAVQESLDAITKALESGRDATDFYLCIVFKDDQDRLSFTEALGLDDNTFQDGNRLRELLVVKKMSGQPLTEDA
jgi:ParB-like chromosome segregation protein Spo0J